jgi:hypothetical protein
LVSEVVLVLLRTDFGEGFGDCCDERFDGSGGDLSQQGFEFSEELGTLEDHDIRRRAVCSRDRRALVFDGPMDGPSFRAYVEQFVVPILREGDIVVMDNLPKPQSRRHPRSHRGRRRRAALPALVQPRLVSSTCPTQPMCAARTEYDGTLRPYSGCQR